MGGGGWGIGSGSVIVCCWFRHCSLLVPSLFVVGSVIVRCWFHHCSSSFVVRPSVHRIIHPASRGSQQWGRVVWAVYSAPFGVEVSLA
jgi:hypothetical protein